MPARTAHRKTLTPALLLAAASLPIQSASAQATLQLLPPRIGQVDSHVNGVSADGLIAVGESGSTAVRWVNGVALSLGYLPGGDSSAAYACSADGSVIVGWSDSNGGSQIPFRWTSSGGMVALPLPPSTDFGGATAVSANGDIAAGFSGSMNAFHILATRFTTTAATTIGTLSGYSDSMAMGISGDGSVIVGGTLNLMSSGPGRAFWWTAAGAMVPLPEVAPTGSIAATISSDGRVAAGQSFAPGAQGPAVRWRSCGTVPTTAEVIGTLNAQAAVARAATANGHIIVGSSDPDGPNMKAFAWRESTGIADLKALAAAAGANVTSWTLSEAVGISASGRVIVGNQFNDPNPTRAWILNFTPACLANCDGSTAAPVLNANDFQCFLNAVARGFAEPTCTRNTSYANCDGSTAAPVITANDFQCFINKYAAGCS